MQRYKAYKDSGVEWIGEIPAGWGVAPIKHLATCNDETLPEGTNGEYRFRYVDISAVSENSIGEYQEMRFRDAPSRARRVVRAGDVLVSTVRTYLKAIARVDDSENVIASTGFAVLRPRRIASRFFAYSLLNDRFAQVVSANSVGISYPAINSSELVKLNLAVPGIAEQRAIADYLDEKTAEIDSIVSQTERSIGLLREYRKSVISEAVTKGLNPDAPMRDSGVEWIGEIPAGWELRKLKYLCKMESGATPSKENPGFWSGNIPWISSKEVKDSLISDTSLHISEEGMNSCSTRLHPPGTLAVVVRSGILKHTIPVGKIMNPMTVNQDIKALGFHEEYLADWVRLFFLGFNDALLFALKKDGATVDSLDNEAFENCPVPIPPKKEALAISEWGLAKTAAR